MGLSLKGLDQKGLIDGFGVGNYTGVHLVRRELLVMYALRVFDEAQLLVEAEEKDTAAQLIEIALSYAEVDLLGGADLTRADIAGEMPNPEGGIGIDYSAFDKDYQKFLAWAPSLLSPRAIAMVGLYKFVNHSDCDGRHSYGDAVDILQFLDFVEPVFNESGDAQYYRNLQAFFRNTVEHKGYVAYV